MTEHLHELENLENNTYASFISFKDASEKFDIDEISKGYNPAENFIIVLSVYDSGYESIFTVDVDERMEEKHPVVEKSKI